MSQETLKTFLTKEVWGNEENVALDEFDTSMSLARKCFSGLRIYTKSITWHVKNVIINGVKLGDFRIKITFTSNSFHVKCINVREETYCLHPAHKKKFYHPVLDEYGDMCTGSAKHLIIDRIFEGDLYSVIEMITTILQSNSYNGYVQLAYFGKDLAICSSCGLMIDKITTKTCEKCGRLTCADCPSKNERCRRCW